MKTSARDTELDYEIQELYLTGKQWLADIDFIKCEQIFLEHLLSQSSLVRQKEVGVQLEKASLMQYQLRGEVISLIAELELLILQPNPRIGLKLAEDFTYLQAAVSAALTRLKSLKYQLIAARSAA